MYSISKRFEFSASHALTHLPSEHKCYRLHGHNYEVVIELVSNKLDDRGFVLDYGELDFVKKYIDENLDHRHLNDLFGDPDKTTAERLAEHFAGVVRRQVKNPGRIRAWVSETPNTWASYSIPHSNFARLDEQINEIRNDIVAAAHVQLPNVGVRARGR